jgi:hypothetical protein
VTVLGAALLLVGCSDHSPDPLGVDAPDALPEAGTELPDGFEVPDGAFRIAPVELGLGNDAWSTRLAVDVDPRATTDDVIDQLEEADFTIFSECAPLLRTLQCDVWARPPGSDGSDVLRFTARRWRADLGFEVAGADRLPPALEPWEAGDTPWAERDIDVPPLPTPSPPPSVGEPFDAQDWDGERVVVVDGVEVIPPIFPQGCVTGGFDADLVITGDVDEVAAAYLEQFAPFDEENEPSRTDEDLRTGGIRTTVGASGLGGTTIDLTILHGVQGEPTWGTISRCDD